MGDLIQKAVEVHEVLTRYIQIHNDVFKSSIQRVIPIPGIFQSMDYGKHHSDLTELTNELEALISGAVSDDEFAGALREYAQALFQTISSLRDICGKLYEKSQGDLNSYPKSQYEADLAKYHSYERTYQALGERLNQYFR